MEKGRSTDDIFLELMREETGDSLLSREHALEMPLAKTLLRTLMKSAELEQVSGDKRREAEVPAMEISKSPASQAMLESAIRHTFDLGEFEVPEAERAGLVAASDLVMIDGQRRLRLSDARRAEILDNAIGTEPYQGMLKRAVADDQMKLAEIGLDPIRLPTAWLRRFLVGEVTELDTMPPQRLKAALEARERLRLVTKLAPTVPPIEDLFRRVELGEMLEPLRLLIGADGGWEGSQRRDHFVGREVELKKLRAFVDELSSKSIGEAASRFAINVKQTLLGGEKPAILVVQARGGLGKSTLLAKFMLDHAMGQERPFPFAYLDFDRSSLDPERPRQLLIEIARQVGLQFPQAQQKLTRLSDSIRGEFVDSRSSIGVSDLIRDPFAEFVEIVREHATFGKRAFLLVLDTMEAVQWNSLAIDKLASLLFEFHAKGLDELKVVVSGRAEVPELGRLSGLVLTEKTMELKPLLVKEARQMADALGRGAIGENWNPAWSSVIAGKKEDDFRREPLAVRVAVDLIARARPPERPELADEIKNSGLIHGDFIARMYFKRIVNHVRDPLAQKLAWPGLVVRRVTLEIVRDVLAPVCGLLPDEAEKAFDALGREVWMVTREGTALRHRQDLRARTLPLMRSAESNKFDEIARKALTYFEKYRQRSREDYVEWIYHRLLINERPEEVAHDLSEDFVPLLARAEEDFPRQSPAASYLAARTSESRLSPPRIRALRPNDALYHLSRTSAGVFALDDIALDRVVLDVAKRIDQQPELDSSLNGWARALRIKTGAWQGVPGPDVHREDFSNQTLRMYLFWAARIAPALVAEPRNQLLEECLRLCSFRSGSKEFLSDIGIRSTVQMMALGRIASPDVFSVVDQGLAKLLSATTPNPIPSMQAALRTAIVFGEKSREPALALWLASRRRGIGDRVRSATVSLAELNALAKLHTAAEVLLQNVRKEEHEWLTRFTGVQIVSTFDNILDEVLGNLAGPPASEKKRALSQLFACRDEDWIVPFAYAAARAHQGQYSDALARSVNRYEPQTASSSWFDRKPKLSGDILSWMRLADEAGELAGFAELVLKECYPNEPPTQNLQFLLDCRNAWSRTVAKVIGSEGKMQVDESAVSPSDLPPEPGPIIHVDDPQKERWGGRAARDGRHVRVVIDSVERDIFYFSVVVESTDSTLLEAPVVFHLHDTYPRSVVTIRRIENQQAILREWNAEGVFAIGVQVKNATGRWISLEIDLAETPGLPKRFLER